MNFKFFENILIGQKFYAWHENLGHNEFMKVSENTAKWLLSGELYFFSASKPSFQ